MNVKLEKDTWSAKTSSSKLKVKEIVQRAAKQVIWARAKHARSNPVVFRR